jgi:hypothetical protein
MNRIVYVCAPLKGNIAGNVAHVQRAVRTLSDEYHSNGVHKMPILIVPHFALCGVTFDLNGEMDRKWGMECCLGLLQLSDELLVIGDRITAGMAEEMEMAFRMGIKVTRRAEL